MAASPRQTGCSFRPLAPVFAELCLRGPAHLACSVEHLMLQSRWRAPFSSEQPVAARERLVRAGGAPPDGDDATMLA
jgi:hypothetical protein